MNNLSLTSNDEPEDGSRLSYTDAKTADDLVNMLQTDERLRPLFVDGQFLLSCVNLMEVFGGKNSSPSQMWTRQKKWLQDNKNELFQKVEKMKVASADGKMRPTDYADLATCVHIIALQPTQFGRRVHDLAMNWLGRTVAQTMQYSTPYLNAVADRNAKLVAAGYDNPDSNDGLPYYWQH